jgi:thiamine-phosphate pyrophosphorylase
MVASPFQLLVITDLAVADEASTCRRVLELSAAVGGARLAVALRDHGESARRRFAFGLNLQGTARACGARFLVFDRCDLARALDADGVHLGERSLGVLEARALLGSDAIVGRSCHDASGLERAAADGADYATLSPLFRSPGKGAPLGREAFARLRARVPALPVCALGGVDARSIRAAISAGADAVAMIRGALDASANVDLIAAWPSVMAMRSAPGRRAR